MMITNSIKKNGILLLALSAILTSCEKDTLPTSFAPILTVGSAEGIYRTGALSVYGSIKNPEEHIIQEYGIQYSLYMSFSEPILVAATENPANFSVALDGLEPGESYYYRAYVSSGYSTVYSEARTFKTETTSKPVFSTTTTVSNATLTSFDVEATLLDDGGSEGGLQMRAFIYKQVESEADESLTMQNQEGMKMVDEFNTTITELYAGTLYAVRPVAVAGSGIGYGAIAYVCTKATDNTILSSCTLSDTTSNSISVKARILAEGTHPIVETGFCYSSENTQPTISNLTVQASLENTEFEATLSNLNSATSYYIRAYAKDDQDIVVYGETIEYTVEEHHDLDVVTNNADEITTINARLWGYVRDNNVPVSERGFCWSTMEKQPTVNNANRQVVNTNEDTYSAIIDIDYNTTYYYCAYAINVNGDVYYGEPKSFTSADIDALKVALSDATEVTESSAVISATVTLGYEYRAGYEIKGGILLSKSHAEPTIEATETNSEVSLTLETHLTLDEVVIPFGGVFNLEPDTKYYYRAYAVNEKGLVYSEVKSITTKKRTPTPDDAEFPEVD